ncbi:MAG: VCBS repeat-containing protein [Ferruginibacter sp.]
MPRYWLIAVLLILGIGSCKQPDQEKLFTQLAASQTGIHFSNDIDEKKFSKEAMNEFGYMGGGVGIGDFNNDGLKDIFFTGNQVSSQLYINKGNNKFDDITAKAGIATDSWATGVSVVDINNDGYDDLYVCTYGKGLDKRARNLLFINQHDLSFKEEAEVYGLADSSYSTQAVFFDYDKDGDLDMFLVNYMLNASYAANYIFPKDLSGRSLASDKLYRNEGNANNQGHPVFTDVTRAAGIVDDGFGLGVSVSDLNNDGWPDLYVSNDFISNDELWLNNHNGTFSNRLDRSTKHQSYSSMGCDAADINNDQLIDFATVDMMPEDNVRKKLTYSFMNYDRYEAERSLSYSPEFMRNMLQLNNGNYNLKDTAIPFFSEIGQMAGISETDWSWSILMADFNNDGFKDIHITNGIGRDFINSDFLQFTKTFATNTTGDPVAERKLINEKLVSLDHIVLPNYFYANNGDYTFKDESASAGINELSISNGAAYADLDNDGDLDLVVNNINKEAFVFINNNIEKDKPVVSHSIGFILKGDSLNTKGFGAKIYVYGNGQTQVQEQEPVRGYLSSVDTKLLFGTGKTTLADSVVIIWPNQKRQVFQRLKTDTVYTVYEKNAGAISPLLQPVQPYLFTDVTDTFNVHYKHNDVTFFDYGYQRLLPQKFSQLGPFIATADINNDSLTDFFVGGAFNSYGQVFTQKKEGSFTGRNLYEGIKMQEDMDCNFFDADGDGDADLLITYGDMRYEDTSRFYQPQLFLNDGKGEFTLSNNAIPAEVTTIAGCVSTGDYDGDGDLDVFIGGRVSKKYPLSPRSFILQNNKGVFTDVTKIVCPGLQLAGMVTGAAWIDFDNDKKTDLVIAGEWMPVRFFKNDSKKLTEITAGTGLSQMNGMWRSLIAADVDNDGDMDFVAGNLGLNCRYHIAPEEPMKLFAKDIDGNGSIDPVMFYYIKNKEGKKELYPSIGRDMLADQVPAVKKLFLKHADFVNAKLDDIYKNKDGLQELTCDETASCWIENIGDGKFIKHIFPQAAQFAPVNAVICTDVDGDGINDLLLAGNEYQTEVMTGRYDASYGLYLKGNKSKQFTAVSPVASGFILNGDVKSMKLITNARKERLIVIGVNNEYVRLIKINKR